MNSKFSMLIPSSLPMRFFSINKNILHWATIHEEKHDKNILYTLTIKLVKWITKKYYYIVQEEKQCLLLFEEEQTELMLSAKIQKNFTKFKEKVDWWVVSVSRKSLSSVNFDWNSINSDWTFTEFVQKLIKLPSNRFKLLPKFKAWQKFSMNWKRFKKFFDITLIAKQEKFKTFWKISANWFVD